ncbi:MAG: hypothetical protein QXG91_03965 [Candidatus Aenigmatarchaeota archaeon]
MAKIKDYLWRYKIIILIFVFLPIFVFAHCPLCTAGAGIGAIIAKKLGLKSSVIGIWIGAFSLAMGWWLANVIKKRNINFKFLDVLLILISFLSIVLPLKLYFYETGSFYLYLFGDYGSLFNRTYIYDKFLVGSILGGLIILVSPLISKKIAEFRKGKIFPYQGLSITFFLLILFSLVFQFFV